MDAVWRFVRKVMAREGYHPVLTYPLFLLRVQIVRARYRRTLKRLRAKVAKGERIRVVFLSMDTSKWKCQSVYDLLKDDARFDPVVALQVTDEDENHTSEQIAARNRVSRAFYEKHGCRVVEACDAEARRATSLSDLGADIVFYQVPWGNLSPQTVWEVSRFALCCYVPYSIETIEVRGKSHRFNLDHQANFHALLYAVFQWSEGYAESYRGDLQPWEWAGTTYGFGHPTLDGYADADLQVGECVIYAPHFAFSFNGQVPMLNIGTFPWSGRALLAYAQAHPEIKWVFKPHPKLRERLVEIGFMTKDEVDAYYAAWEKLGVACYDGDYAGLFAKSRAMVTDCGSFLFEYMPTGNPLIRLIPDNILVVPNPPARAVCDTFYNCHSSDEMFAAFRQILEGHADPKREARLAESRKANLIGNDCAVRIADYLRGHLGLT